MPVCERFSAKGVAESRGGVCAIHTYALKFHVTGRKLNKAVAAGVCRQRQDTIRTLLKRCRNLLLRVQ